MLSLLRPSSVGLVVAFALAARAAAQCTAAVPAPTIGAPTPIANAMAALNVTCPGGPWVLNLSAAVYNEQVLIPNGVEVSINGALPFGSSTLDGTGLGDSVMIFGGGQTNTSVLQNFVIANGTAGPLGGFNGGGIHIPADTRPILRNLTIVSCSAPFSGGGVFIDATWNQPTFPPILRISRVIFRANHADFRGGGVAVTGSGVGAAVVPPDDVLIKLSNFFENTAGTPVFGGTGFGGAIDTSGTRVMHVDHTMFDKNTADIGGGGVSVGEAGRARITQCVLEHNDATGLGAFGAFGGGGVFTSEASLCEVLDSTFELNKASTVATSGTGHGGHVFVQHAHEPVLLRNNLYYQGKAPNGGAVAVINDGLVAVEMSTFNQNTGTNGGAIFFSGFDPLPSLTVIDSIAFLDIGVNASPATGSLEIFEVATLPDVSLCDVQHPGFPATYPAGAFGANINLTPGWVTGYACAYAPRNTFFLSALSPCVNGGSTTLYPELAAGFSTQTTGAADALPVDQGFHYPPTSCP